MIALVASTMSGNVPKLLDQCAHRKGRGSRALHSVLLASALFGLLIPRAFAEQASSTKDSVVVQPGAPGQPSRTLPSSTHPTVPRVSPADVAFMQGMIMHHSQAVEMTALIPSHTENKELRSLGARIVEPLERKPWGLRQFTVEDLDGNRFYFHCE